MELQGTFYLIQLKAAFFGGSIPNATPRLSNDNLGWSSKVKYLRLYLTGGANFRIDLNTAKQKYFGCFNNIKSVTGQQVK